MARTEQRITSRHAVCRAIMDSLERARVSPILHRLPGSDRSTITAHINYGYGGLQRIQVVVDDAGSCSVYLSPLFDVFVEHPDDEDSREFVMSRIMRLDAATPALGEIIVRGVRRMAFRAGE